MTLGFPVVVHALRVYDVQVLCIRGVPITMEERVMLDLIFPNCLEIGIPKICVFFLSDHEPLTQNVCFWCNTSPQNTFLDLNVDVGTLYQL